MNMGYFYLLFFLVSIEKTIEGYSLNEQLTCAPSSARNSSIDDVPAINDAFSKCGNEGTIVIPSGEIFMIRSPLDISNCNACHFQIEGTLRVSDDLDFWHDKVVFIIRNASRAKFYSATGAGLIDGNGQKYWDYHAKNSSYQRPYLIHFLNSSNVTFNNLNLKNSPRWFITVNESSNNILFSDLILTAVSNSSNPPANTDGFNTLDSSFITIRNTYVKNGDDCVAFKTGSNYITVENITCIGSHGLSVGSLGLEPKQLHNVTNVYMSNIKMIDCSIATRIKFYPDDPAHGRVFINNITYKDITIDNCDIALQIDNCYMSPSTTCRQYPSTAKISNVTFINITGKTSKKIDPVVAKIECPPDGTCDLTFTQWNITAPSGRSTVICDYYKHPIGITCAKN